MSEMEKPHELQWLIYDCVCEHSQPVVIEYKPTPDMGKLKPLFRVVCISCFRMTMGFSFGRSAIDSWNNEIESTRTELGVDWRNIE